LGWEGCCGDVFGVDVFVVGVDVVLGLGFVYGDDFMVLLFLLFGWLVFL